MKIFLCFLISLICSVSAIAQNDTIILRDTDFKNYAPSGFDELVIPSSGHRLQGFIYLAAGKSLHPTLILLHGFPGNERNLDLAQVARARGWNVVYFDYSGSWGSEGVFSFKNCVTDVVNVFNYLKAKSRTYKIDTTRISLFGHSMGGWVCMKALEQLPEVKKGFALSTWNISNDFEKFKTREEKLKAIKSENFYFVLHTTAENLYGPVVDDPAYFNLVNDAQHLATKNIVMLDEHHENEALATQIKKYNKAGFSYEVWNTDHPFTNRRAGMMKRVLAFLKD